MQIQDIEQYLELPYLRRDIQNYDPRTYTAIDRLYQYWDGCDCSKLTLLKILLIQQILKQRQHRNNEQKWLKDTDWQKYRYIGIDACQGCKSLFTHKPRLKKYGTNYLWERKWYQLKIFGCQATQIDICSNQRDKELEDIQLKPEHAKLIDLHALVAELADALD